MSLYNDGYLLRGDGKSQQFLKSLLFFYADDSIIWELRWGWRVCGLTVQEF